MLSEATSGLSFSAGCSRSSMLMVGAPPVVKFSTTSAAARILAPNWRKSSGSWVGLPSFGLRACRCTIAAPACAAPSAASAISSGVMGRYGDMLGVWIEPVTAHVMMTLPCAAAIAWLPGEIATRSFYANKSWSVPDFERTVGASRPSPPRALRSGAIWPTPRRSARRTRAASRPQWSGRWPEAESLELHRREADKSFCAACFGVDGVRHVLRAEREGAGLQRHARVRDPEGEFAVEDVEPLVLLWMDVPG